MDLVEMFNIFKCNFGLEILKDQKLKEYVAVGRIYYRTINLCP